MFAQTKQPQLQLVIVTGLPGTGKSTFAEYAGRLLLCPVFSKDWLEASLWRSGIGREANSGWAAYDLLTTLAENQLRLKQSAILGRKLSWEEAESVGARYEPWQDDRLVLDTIHPLEGNLDALHSYLL